MDLRQHYQQLYTSVTPEFSFTSQTPQALLQWQQAFRPRLLDAMGLTRMAHELSGHQPHAQQVSTESLDGYTRQSWLLWTEPTVSLPFYLLRPDPCPSLAPLVLTPHGHNHPHIYAGISHNDAERKSINVGDRDIGVQAVQQGYTVIAPTTRGFGEMRTQQDIQNNKLCSCRTALMHGLLVGRTPIGERIWDISRLLDWALANLPVDPRRIAITGNSGGGTISLFASACDTRISVAAPSCYFCTFRGSIGSIHHCDCNYIPGLLRLGEMYDIAGLIAPRPFLAIAGNQDDIFPVAEVRLAYEKLLQIYTVAGAADRCRLFIGEGGHRYYKAAAWPFLREFL